jgi:Uma2 family endonuclease
MALQYAEHSISISEYLEGERFSEVKHEYIDGEVYAMGGASRIHNIISSNTARILGNHLDDTPCTTFSSDMKVKANNCFFYPDVMVVCDDDKGDEYFTEAPVIIVEVLSKSTRRLDKATKMAIYKTIPSLQEYVLIEQDVVDVEVCRRSAGWVSEHYFLGDDITFESIDITLSCAAIYHRVNNEDMQAYLVAQADTNHSEQSLIAE